MTAIAKQELVILWQHEIRAAARLLRKFLELNERDLALDAEKASEERVAALNDALGACAVALHGAEDETKGIVMVAAPDVKLPGARRRS